MLNSIAFREIIEYNPVPVQNLKFMEEYWFSIILLNKLNIA